MKTKLETMNMKPWRVAMAGLSLALVSPLTWAAAAIQAITSTQQAGADVVRIELSEPLAALPAGFIVQTPPRIAIDLPGVGSELERSVVEINQGNVRTVNVAQAGERTRLVLNLRQATTYTATLQGKTLLLSLAPAVTSNAPQSAGTTRVGGTEVVHFAENKNINPLALKDIDFRRGQDGSGRVVIDLPNNQVGVDIKQQGQALVVEFMRTTLPERLRRRFDVTDFGTPVQNMTAEQVGDRVKLTVKPKGDWEHSAYQSDNQFVLEVRARKAEPNKLTPGPGYAGEKLSLNFQNIEVRALLQVIADFTNFNVVTSDTVTGTVTLRLKDVPWDQALDIIMQAKGLGVRKTGNVLWIAPKDEIYTKEKLDLEAKKQIQDLEPLRTQAFQLNYSKAEEVAKRLTGESTSGSSGTSTKTISLRGSVFSEPRTNQVFVTDIPSKLEEIQQMIAKIDIPMRQVLIEARIVEATDTFGRNLGVKLGGVAGNRSVTPGQITPNGGGSVVTGNYLGAGETAGQAAITGQSYIPNTYFVNMPAAGINGINAASVALSLFGANSNRFLNLELSALEAEGKGKVVSSPRVITADQVKALIEQGTELPYQTVSQQGTNIQFRKASMKLEVTPQITPEGGIILDVDVNKDSVGRITTAGYAIDTKHVKTTVLVENGGTVVIGGIYIQSESENVSQVPLLGDIPVLGHLFKMRAKASERSELLIFLTPKVITEKGALR
jgi:type IV pilus assembly protein PilQ